MIEGAIVSVIEFDNENWRGVARRVASALRNNPEEVVCVINLPNERVNLDLGAELVLQMEGENPQFIDDAPDYSQLKVCLVL